jgi:ferredoxin
MGNRSGTTAVELTEREVRLARANIAYAIENCPVDGGIVTEDGHLSSPQIYEALKSKLQSVEVKPINTIAVNDEELKFLISTAEYALENCPVEGKIMMEDAQFSSTEMFKAYINKLQSYQTATAMQTK